MAIEIPRPVLKGKKAFVAGIANEHSIAYGCAKAFRELGAELAITYGSEKSKSFVEPLAQQLEASIFMPLDVSQPDQLEAVFAARHPGTLDRLRAQAGPPGRAAQLLGGGFRHGDGHFLSFFHPHGQTGRPAHDRGRRDVCHELPRRG
jgi:NAD(P)-dependent dehydrogenase (short-subunit alcohol dehydrogenase family)